MFYFNIVYSTLKSDNEHFEQTIGDYKQLLMKHGGVESGVKRESSLINEFYFMATGGTEKALLKLPGVVERLKQKTPIYLIAHPEFNSLPASMETLARLQMDGALGQIIYLKSTQDESAMATIKNLSEGR